MAEVYFCVDCMRDRFSHWFEKIPSGEKKIVCDECSSEDKKKEDDEENLL